MSDPESSAGRAAGMLFLAAVVCSLLVAIATLIAVVGSKQIHSIALPTKELRIVEVSSDLPGPLEARAALHSKTSNATYFANRQPTGPFWLSVPIVGWAGASDSKVIEFRMIRTASMQFWKLSTDRSLPPVQLESKNQKGGIAVAIQLAAGESAEVIGVIDPITVARPKIFAWDEALFQESEMHFERWGGALLGAFVVLAIFSALVGAFNKDWSFFLFSGWLITSLRVASINDGWDFYWLGIESSGEPLLILLRTTLAAHALLTISLFRSLLAKDLNTLSLDRWLVYGCVVFGVVVILAFALPHSIFLPIVWTTSFAGIVLILVSLGVVVSRTRSSVSIWYTGSWVLTFAGLLSEVAYASGITSTSIAGLNSQTASIASAIFIAIALAEKLRVERLARMEAQREKFEALEKLTDNYNSMPVGLFSVDHAGMLTLFNPAFAAMFGLREKADLRTHSISMERLIGLDAFTQLTDYNSGTEETNVELRISLPNSGPQWFLARTANKQGSIEGSIQDITSRKDAEAKLRRLVDHDSLTGMLNRRGLEEIMQVAKTAVSAGASCAISHVDIDRFKLVNDLYGHATGDMMLMHAAARLRNVVRTSDYVARIGDSFVVVLMDCPEHAVVRLTERLRESIADGPFELDGKSLNVTVSIGVVALEPSMSPVDAMAAADRACAEAKSRGRNCVVRLNEQDATLKSHLDELKMVASLQRRIETDRYFLEFQPIVSLRSAYHSLSYEVLIRMKGDDGQVIPPGRFIGVAERNGLMSQIDRWVLHSTLAWLDAHPEHRDRLSFATINLSGASLNDVRFVEDAFSMIAEHPLAMTKLCFEVTETVALRDVGSTRRFVDRVRSYGSKVALDDFGAGYTSFNYLKEIPADFIKIDGSFVKDINTNPANYAITRTIVDLTHELGMSSIAEWAESPDIVASLADLRVDYAQGYGLAYPMAKEIVTQASSSGSLVRDPQVVSLLVADALPWVTMQPVRGHRH